VNKVTWVFLFPSSQEKEVILFLSDSK